MTQEYTAYISINEESHELDFVVDSPEFFALKKHGIENSKSIAFLVRYVSIALKEEHDVNDYTLHSITVKPYTTLKSTSFDTLIAFASYWAIDKVDISNFPKVSKDLDTKSKLQLIEAISIGKSESYKQAYNQYLIQSKLEKLTL